MSLFKLIDKQTFISQQITNVYWYEDSDLGDWEDLADAFIANVLPPVAVLQCDDLVHNTVEVINLDDLTDFGEKVSSVPGDVTNDPGAPFLAYSVKLVRATRAVRNGYKRIAGIAETAGGAGDISGLTVHTQLQSAGDAMVADLVGTNDTYSPRIVHRIKDVNGNIIGYTPYAISAALAGRYTTTQNSRKRGRGQ